MLLIVLHWSLFSAPGMVKKITGGHKITYHPEGPEGEAWEVDFTTPFKRLDMMLDLEKELGVPLPKPDQLHTPGNFKRR